MMLLTERDIKIFEQTIQTGGYTTSGLLVRLELFPTEKKSRDRLLCLYKNGYLRRFIREKVISRGSAGYVYCCTAKSRSSMYNALGRRIPVKEHSSRSIEHTMLLNDIRMLFTGRQGEFSDYTCEFCIPNNTGKAEAE